MKSRLLLAAAFLLLSATNASQAKRIVLKPNVFLSRLDGIFRLVSESKSLADGQKSRVPGKALGYAQFSPKQKLPGAATERLSWYQSTGRWGYTAELGRFGEAEADKQAALEKKLSSDLDAWLVRHRDAPRELVLNRDNLGGTRLVWLCTDETTQTRVELVSQYSATLKKNAVVLRVVAM